MTPTGRSSSSRTREPEELPCTTNRQSPRTTRPKRPLTDSRSAARSPTCKEEPLVVARVLRDLVGHGEHDRATQREVRTQLDETRRTVVAAVPEAGGAEVVPVIDHRLARGLHEFAEAENASILVLGSSHRGPLGRRLIGGTADVVLSGAPCPVAVAPPDYNKSANPLSPAVFGVAYDGSPTARAALDLGVRLAQAAGATLRLIAVRHHGDAQELERGLAEVAATGFPRRSRARPSSRPAIPPRACSTRARTRSACSWPARAATVRCGASCSEVSRAVSCARPACRSSSCLPPRCPQRRRAVGLSR